MKYSITQIENFISLQKSILPNKLFTVESMLRTHKANDSGPTHARTFHFHKWLLETKQVTDEDLDKLDAELQLAIAAYEHEKASIIRLSDGSRVKVNNKIEDWEK